MSEQYHSARAMIKGLCSNYDNSTGGCLLLDRGEIVKCPQLASGALICRYFRDVLLEDPDSRTLKAEIMGDSISSAAYAFIHAYELQGFINGFRLCAQLGRELLGMERSTINSGKYMAAIQGLAGLASPRQIRFLEGRGFIHVERWPFETAKDMIDRIAANGWRVPPEVVPQEYEPERTEAAV